MRSRHRLCGFGSNPTSVFSSDLVSALPLFAFVIGQDDFLMGEGVEIFRSHIENAAEHEFEFLCRSDFSSATKENRYC